ncbi:MAG: glutathionylspermidine synthase family protein [Planctomycetes bacterium]|nr:glutathionylspermidine synthase family protein [Planctomycetota bacterium]
MACDAADEAAALVLGATAAASSLPRVGRGPSDPDIGTIVDRVHARLDSARSVVVATPLPDAAVFVGHRHFQWSIPDPTVSRRGPIASTVDLGVGCGGSRSVLLRTLTLAVNIRATGHRSRPNPADGHTAVNVVDLVPEFVAIVRSSRTAIEFKARFWHWVDRQRDGALAPLLDDMVRLWSGVGNAHDLAVARSVADRLESPDRVERVARARRVIARFVEVAGHEPETTVVLFAGLRRPEGYSRFDRGRNTVFLALDHPNSLTQDDHFDVILAHELTHAVRDPAPAVLACYGGWPAMSHDDFVARHPFREHLVSEGLATAISERVWPGKPAPRYVYFDEVDYAWCEAHRATIAERMRRALDDGEDYRTFYVRGSVTSDSPDCCDYYFGFHFGRFALAQESAAVLLHTPAAEVLARFFDPFVAAFTGQAAPALSAAVAPSARPARPATAGAELLPHSVRRFHADLAAEVTARPDEAERDRRAFEAAIANAGLVWGDRPYDVWPFPLALGEEDVEYVRWVAERLMRTIEKVIGHYRDDEAMRAYFGFPRALEQLACLDPGYRPLVPIGRFDSFWNGKEVRFIELNTNGTAAIPLADRIGTLFCELPHVAPIAARHGVQVMPIVAALVATIRACFAQATGASPDARPRVAIVDWPGLPTTREQAQLGEALTDAGMPTVLAGPAELDYDGARLRARGEPIDVVYRRLTLVDLLHRSGELEPLLRAAADRRVVVVGPFAADIAHSKRLFAVLTHERWRNLFTPAERALIDAHVPWTRMFRAGTTLWGGRTRDLRELALAERERFVLKPAEGQEGRDVLLGIETSAEQWEREVARRWGGDQVIQERIDAPVRTLQVARGGHLESRPVHVHLGEFVFGGVLAGFLARASTALVLSPHSDDRALPCLVVLGATEDRSDLGHP